MLGKIIVNIELFFIYFLHLHLLFTLSYFYENTIINHN